MNDTFWINNPTILFNKEQIFDIIPRGNNSIDANLNAMTRLILIISIVGYIYNPSPRILISFFVSIVVIILYHKFKHNDNVNHKNQILKEGFDNPEFYKEIKQDFTNPTPLNPLMNVMIPEIKYNPDRKEAAPAFVPEVEKEINEAFKSTLNPRLFKDLGDNIAFEQSMRNFYTMPNTSVVNDQKAFAEFCYGNMKSCKDGDVIECDKNNYRYTNP